MKRHAAFACAIMALAACSSKPTPSPTAQATGNQDDWVTNALEADAARHNYVEKEGNTYRYVTAVSEEDKKKGRAVGSVISYRYLGLNDGKYTLANVTDDGRTIARNECSNPCKIIHLDVGGSTSLMPYDASSVIGSAFEDAIDGKLEAVAAPIAKVREKLEIPASFLGEWNEDIASCGTGEDASALSIEPGYMNFYESRATFKKIVISNERSVTADVAISSEEGDGKQQYRMMLSPDKRDLTIDGFVRHRCP